LDILRVDLIGTLMGSAINLPLFSMKAEEPSEEARQMFSGLLFGRPLPLVYSRSKLMGSIDYRSPGLYLLSYWEVPIWKNTKSG
jgi:hypothetical protein